MQTTSATIQNTGARATPVDTVGYSLHHRPTMMLIDRSEPKLFQILRAKQRIAQITQSSQLTVDDSVKINLKGPYPANYDWFSDNVLTRMLHAPVSIAAEKNTDIIDIQTINDAVQPTLINIDTLSNNVIRPIETTATSKHLNEKLIKINGFESQITWIGPLFLALWLYAGMMKVFSSKYISLLFKSLFNQQHADNLYQMVKVRRNLATVGIDFLFILVLALFFTVGAVRMGAGPNNLASPAIYAMVCGALAAAIVLKTVGYTFIGYIFNRTEATGKFIFFVFSYIRMMAFALLPIATALAFVDQYLVLPLIITGLFLIIAMYALQVAQGIRIFLQNSAALFYMFLYLCALEILPILVLYKLISR
jgi:hypothetical protein